MLSKKKKNVNRQNKAFFLAHNSELVSQHNQKNNRIKCVYLKFSEASVFTLVENKEDEEERD